jgi:peptidoglycan hydrolase-like protein with peptidoglycan-binding domain
MTEAQSSVTWPILRRGSTGPQVRTLQYLLRASGRSVAADNVFGSLTEAAVRDYQKDAGLSVDGVVGERTWSSLTGNRFFRSMVRRGDTGDAVRAAQNELDRHNYPLVIDGIFGEDTDAAARAFQEIVGLEVDGIVGPNTWRELITRKPD